MAQNQPMRQQKRNDPFKLAHSTYGIAIPREQQTKQIRAFCERVLEYTKELDAKAEAFLHRITSLKAENKQLGELNEELETKRRTNKLTGLPNEIPLHEELMRVLN